MELFLLLRTILGIFGVEVLFYNELHCIRLRCILKFRVSVLRGYVYWK
jgi:hypothetical protein